MKKFNFALAAAIIGMTQINAAAQDQEKLLRVITNGLKTCGYSQVQREGSLFRIVESFGMKEFDLDDMEVSSTIGAFFLKCEAFACVRTYAPQLGGSWHEGSPTNLIYANCGSFSQKIGDVINQYLDTR